MVKSAVSKSVLGLTAALCAGFASPAGAADFGRPYAPAYAPTYAMYNWAGPYLGGLLGYQWGTTSNNPTKPSGFEGGITAGYNWQNGPWVYGLEGDLNLSSASDRFAAWKFSNPWFGTLRGRGGYAINNVLFYGTIGLAFGTVRGEVAALTESKLHAGFVGGLGAEFGFTPNWSGKIEYIYVNLAEQNYAITGTSNGVQSHIFRIGVNYRF